MELHSEFDKALDDAHTFIPLLLHDELYTALYGVCSSDQGRAIELRLIAVDSCDGTEIENQKHCETRHQQ